MDKMTTQEISRQALRSIGEALAEVYIGAESRAFSHRVNGEQAHEVGLVAVEAYARTFGYPTGGQAFADGVLRLIDLEEKPE